MSGAPVGLLQNEEIEFLRISGYVFAAIRHSAIFRCNGLIASKTAIWRPFS
jgi:hypothetical protein